MTPKPLTRRQREVLIYLVEYQQQHGYPPIIREIVQAFGWSGPNAAKGCLDRIKAAGWIDWDFDKSRTLRILHYPLPVFRPDGGELVYAGDVCVEVNGEEDDGSN